MLYCKKGSALILAMITGLIIISFAGSAIFMSATDYRQSSQESRKMKARYVAESGLARGVKYLNSNFANSPVSFSDVEKLATASLYNEEALYAPHQGSTVKLGEYTVTVKILSSADMEVPTGVDIVGTGSNSVRYISLVSTGCIPNSRAPLHKVTIKATYEIGTQVAHVFDYCYFINNWGWFYGNNILAIGNVRSNGTFDFGSYRPKIDPKPRFESSEGNDLIGYIDDNGDGKEDNQDGGVYAWDIIKGTPATNPKADLYQGLKGASKTPEVPQTPMPNLNNLALYENIAKQQQSSIFIGGMKICDGIFGDNEGGKQHLYLEGTKENPIKIDGTVVVYGDVIIRGWVTGQGAIYSGRNVYIPQRLLYVNAPGERQPGTNSEASRENWRSKYETNDMLGLFAKEHIVLSDYTSSTWQSNVKSWVEHPLNISKEDSGADKIPNTKDSGEGDNVWTVERDSNNQPIPGTGEDIDGDGKYDGSTQMSEFNLAKSLTSDLSSWGGNIPSGLTSFRQLSYWDETTDNPTTNLTTGVQHFPQVDAVLYTNHFVAGYVANPGYNYKDGNDGIYYSGGQTQKVIFNGCIVSRNESIIFDSKVDLIIAHDERMSAEDGSRFGFILPRVWKPLSLVSMSIQ